MTEDGPPQAWQNGSPLSWPAHRRSRVCGRPRKKLVPKTGSPSPRSPPMVATQNSASADDRRSPFSWIPNQFDHTPHTQRAPPLLDLRALRHPAESESEHAHTALPSQPNGKMLDAPARSIEILAGAGGVLLVVLHGFAIQWDASSRVCVLDVGPTEPEKVASRDYRKVPRSIVSCHRASTLLLEVGLFLLRHVFSSDPPRPILGCPTPARWLTLAHALVSPASVPSLRALLGPRNTRLTTVCFLLNCNSSMSFSACLWSLS